MEQATVQITVAERNPQVGQTSQGTPKLGVKSARSGKWIQVTGEGVDKIQVGQNLVITEPKAFGKQSFATLKEIIQAAAPSSNGNGQTAPRFDSRPKKLTWDEFERTYRAAHAIVMDLEPDGYRPAIGESETKEGTFTTPITTIDRSAARATMMNTIVMSLTGKESGGMIEPAPEVPF